jgi:Fe2+ or Zn2+ uptake regulation protein
MSKTFAELQTEDRRLVILRLLEQSAGYRANAYLLQTALETQGHHASLDRVEGDVSWLAEQELVRSESVGGVTIATLTTRGADVASGRAKHPGVKKPLPE